MATFEAKVYRLTIEEHPNADALELAVIGDYRAIVRKGQFKTGDLGVYIVEGSIVPKWILQSMDLWDDATDKGRLAGPNGDRVKSIKLRGILSTGLIYPVDSGTDTGGPFITIGGEDGVGSLLPVTEGQDVAGELCIEKYSPPIPVHMAGEVFNAHGMTLKYDIENVQKFPDVLTEGEDVIMTEKIHGTWLCLGYHPNAPHHIVTSKGLSSQGLAFKLNEANANNLYIRALNGTAPYEDGSGGTVLDRAHELFGYETPFYILGEAFGPVQDLKYGADKPQFRIFDIYVGEPERGRYVNAEELQSYCTALGVQMVPIIYTGPFSKEKMKEVTTGKETVSGQHLHIREGVVVKPTKERHHVDLGRVVLKSVSEQYLLRKGNTTEFN